MQKRCQKRELEVREDKHRSDGGDTVVRLQAPCRRNRAIGTSVRPMVAMPQSKLRHNTTKSCSRAEKHLVGPNSSTYFGRTVGARGGRTRNLNF